MMKEKQLTQPQAPNLIGAIRSGFDAVANHILLILFPIALDLILWVGPRLRLTDLIKSVSNQLFGMYALQDPTTPELIAPIQEAWSGIAEQFNLLTALRSYPVGVTSLIVSLMPLDTPIGSPVSWEITSPVEVFIAWLVASILGVILGTLFFTVVAQAATSGGIRWRQALEMWPWASVQMLFLTILAVVLVILIIIPGSFILSLIVLSGISFSQCLLLFYAGFAVWLIMPLVFSPHGIILNRNNVVHSIKASVKLLRKSLPMTMLFIMAVFLLSKGLDILWLVPSETSWLLLVGILGHAFITTALLASSFVYYRDAMQWIQGLVRISKVTTI